MVHRAWSSIVEVPYCLSRSYVKFQGHTALKIIEFDPNWAFYGQQLQFEFTDGYEMLHKAWNSKGEVPYCFPRSSIKFQGHTGQNITNFDPNWAFPDYRPVAAFKSLRFALLITSSQIIHDHTEIIQYQHLFIYFIHNISPFSLCSVKACHLIKLPPVNLSPAAFS